MQIITSITEMQARAESLRRSGKTLGFVPTMGFLHEGHLALMRTARDAADVVAVSIFVNPTQFGPNEDFDRYPRDEEGDRMKCESVGVDILFLPSPAEMYPEKPSVFVTVDGLSEVLEGAIRPGHFRGVATVVSKLFHIVKPHKAFFGRKDYQQCAVIRRMVKGLNLDVEIAVLPTVREPDGLAMSSRNVYLSLDERKAATALSRALGTGERLIRSGEHNVETIRNAMLVVIGEVRLFSVDYCEIADPDSLTPLERVERQAVLLIAARIGRTRLIDNALVL